MLSFWSREKRPRGLVYTALFTESEKGWGDGWGVGLGGLAELFKEIAETTDGSSKIRIQDLCISAIEFFKSSQWRTACRFSLCRALLTSSCWRRLLIPKMVWLLHIMNYGQSCGKRWENTYKRVVWLHFLPWPDHSHCEPTRLQLAQVGFSLPQRIFFARHWSHTNEDDLSLKLFFLLMPLGLRFAYLYTRLCRIPWPFFPAFPNMIVGCMESWLYLERGKYNAWYMGEYFMTTGRCRQRNYRENNPLACRWWVDSIHRTSSKLFHMLPKAVTDHLINIICD